MRKLALIALISGCSDKPFDPNAPHYDPNAFSGGSHGCVNIPYGVPVVGGRQIGWNMEQVYNWTPLGTPIILY